MSLPPIKAQIPPPAPKAETKSHEVKTITQQRLPPISSPTQSSSIPILDSHAGAARAKMMMMPLTPPEPEDCPSPAHKRIDSRKSPPNRNEPLPTPKQQLLAALLSQQQPKPLPPKKSKAPPQLNPLIQSQALTPTAPSALHQKPAAPLTKAPQSPKCSRYHRPHEPHGTIESRLTSCTKNRFTPSPCASPCPKSARPQPYPPSGTYLRRFDPTVPSNEFIELEQQPYTTSCRYS